MGLWRSRILRQAPVPVVVEEESRGASCLQLLIGAGFTDYEAIAFDLIAQRVCDVHVVGLALEALPALETRCPSQPGLPPVNERGPNGVDSVWASGSALCVDRVLRPTPSVARDGATVNPCYLRRDCRLR